MRFSTILEIAFHLILVGVVFPRTFSSKEDWIFVTGFIFFLVWFCYATNVVAHLIKEYLK